MSQNVSLESLLQNQQDLQGRIARAFENLKKVGATNYTVGIVESRLQALEQNWKKFESQHEYMLVHYGTVLKSSVYATEHVFSITEEAYLTQKGQFLDVLSNLKPSSVLPSPAANSTIGGHDPRPSPFLPRIQLPQFSGNYADWASFRDIFTSLIRKDVTLTNVEKLHYLKTCVKGEAELLLRNITIINENLTVAWNLLKDRYENKRLIIRSYLSAITSLPAMTSESSDELKRLLHTLNLSVGGLEAIGRPISSNTDLLVHLITENLDKTSRRDWENSISASTDPPSYEALKTFLENKLRTLEALLSEKAEKSEKDNRSSRRTNNSAKTHLAEKQKGDKRRCALCSKNHFVLFCKDYQAKSPSDRKDVVMKMQLCLNCLGRHALADCRSAKTCAKCANRHHSTIHDAMPPVQSAGSTEQISEPTSPPRATLVSQKSSSERMTVLLATALVRVSDNAGDYHFVRALIDPGSEVSLVAESLVQRLHLARQSASVPIVGIGAQSSGVARFRVRLRVASRVNSATNLRVSALVLPRLTNYGVTCRDIASLGSHLRDISLADPLFNRRQPVELLLSADIYSSILEDGIRRGPPGTPVAQKTSLGWILMDTIDDRETITPLQSLQCSVDDELNSLVRRFWEQEESPASPAVLTEEEQYCENHFVRTHFRLDDGRYVVRLPTKQGLPSLAQTRRPAQRLLFAMERRFSHDPGLEELYRSFLQEYLHMGHMAPAHAPPGERTCYLPHHRVVKKLGTVRKIRVVFNGSQHLPSGESLNDFLLPGPKLLPELSDIVLRWRLHEYVFTADVQKMYRQIRVHSADQDLQWILWRNSPSDEIGEFQLKTVTYGLSCAPFLAIRTLHQLAADEGSRFPRAAEILKRDVYVDDILTGASSLQDALVLQRELIGLCMAGGFPLSKWAANHESLLSAVPRDTASSMVTMSWEKDTVHSALGLQWHPQDDYFSFTLKLKPFSSKVTKRTVLSGLAQMFDPLGWLSPVAITAKIFLQSLWLQRLEWDAPLAPLDEDFWKDFLSNLPYVERFRIPRFLGRGDSLRELRGFSDASERAYAAVIFLRSINQTGNVETSLLLAKAKVAPLKQISLPRLELTAAALLVRLVSHVKQLFSESNLPIHLWTDSTVTLGWIQGHPSRWKTFVANRVSEIQRTLPEAHWYHVDGRHNPADCASRGLRPLELECHSMWWHGPHWFSRSSAEWSSFSCPKEENTLPEQRGTVLVALSKDSDSWSLLSRYSSFTTLLRVTAWCRRWFTGFRCRSASPPDAHYTVPPFLTAAELQESKFFWIRYTQQSHFHDEMALLRRGQPLPARSPIAKLAPIFHTDGTLRVGRRLKHSLLCYDEMHPIILPRDSHFTKLLVLHYHHFTLHGGAQVMLNSLRRHFWILQGRRVVKRCIHHCTTCIRWRATTRTQLMGSLPGNRVTPSRPFLHTGLDYAGPLSIRTSKGRGQKSHKGYIVIFVCCSTKAVHIELASDYSTEAFLAAYRRSVSRRGLCRSLASDCGTNLVGAEAQLRRLLQASSQEFQTIAKQLAKEGVEWRFNPPAAPHFGGLWEAAVKLVKYHLRRVIGETTLTFEELYTVLTQIEAYLNSRPLQALSDDPDDLSPLIPGHFLIGAPLICLPEPTMDDVNVSRLTRWQLLQHMRNDFWRRWSQEYLHTLQSRVKWWRAEAQPHIGDLCLVKNEIYPPSRWPLARITHLHPGDDGKTRVVTVRTSTTELRRPITKIVLLPGTSEK